MKGSISLLYFIHICLGELKVLQYFGNVIHNSTTWDVFAKIMNMTKYTELWNTWYSLDTLWVLLPWFALMDWTTALESMVLDLPDHIWSSRLLTIWVKFLESSSYSIMIKCAFTFHITKVFGCFHGIIAKFELVKYKFPKLIMLPFICAAFK